MAMIGGQTPTPQELPGDYKRRVVVKFRPDVRLAYTTDAQTQFANTAPRGPVYINLDAEMQEAKLAEPLAPIDAARFMPPANPGASAALIKEAAAILKGAKHPVIMMGRVSRSLEGWNNRVALAETLNAKVVSDLKIACGFPTDHPLHAGAPA